ncbi:MAG: S8 family serine peptidase, partial [Anaerolineales bacterium]|nr:S8 family serine peptidase [Anaerolineales bacterium]
MSAYQAGYQQAYEQIAPQTKGNGAYGSQGPSSLRFPFPFPPRFPIWPFPWPRRQPVGWNIQLVRAEKVWHRVTGRGVKVAIIDTGIDNNHADLTVRGGASFVPGVASWDDDHGHGTHCAGIVAASNNFTG